MRTGLLLSGGIDSICVAWWKRPDVALTIDYGQLPAAAEIAAARAISRSLKLEHRVVTVDCRLLGSGDLAGIAAHPTAPASDWWPYRNQLLVTIAAMEAMRVGISRLWLGTVKGDGLHADGRPEFVSAMGALLAMQEGGLALEAPAINMSTVELARVSRVPDEILAWAHSCHRASVPCGTCRGCNKYFEVRSELYE